MLTTLLVRELKNANTAAAAAAAAVGSVRKLKLINHKTALYLALVRLRQFQSEEINLLPQIHELSLRRSLLNPPPKSNRLRPLHFKTVFHLSKESSFISVAISAREGNL